MSNKVVDAALDRLMDDMDDIEGHAATTHSLEDCPNPLECTQHDQDHNDNLSTLADGKPPEISIEIHKAGLPTMEGTHPSKAEDGLSVEEREDLQKLLKGKEVG